MTELKERRPLKVRDARLAQKIAKWLSKKNITPNFISVTSVFFALLSAACFVLMPFYNYLWLPFLAALFIQLRLLCNLFDGMVAVEGGKSTRSGELFNDIPDRIADPLIIVAVGYSIPMFSWAESLGWFAGLLAVMTLFHPEDTYLFKKWWYKRDPTHISFYTMETFQKIAGILNLKILKTDERNICIFRKN